MNTQNSDTTFRNDLSKAVTRIAEQHRVSREDVLREALAMLDDVSGKEMYTVQDLVRRWGCHPNTVYHYVRSGQLRSVKGLHSIKVHRTEIARFERQRGGLDE